MIRLIFVLIMFITLPAYSATPETNDFAWRSPLTFPAGGALYEAIVPLHVYRGITSTELADLCIFNGGNEIVPFRISNPPRPTIRNQITLPHFSIPRKLTAGEKLSVRVERRTSGEVVTVARENAGEVKAAYLLDATKANDPITFLDLEWQGPPDGYVVRIMVEASDDLEHWRPAAQATLASLRRNGSVVEQRKIPMDGIKARYLRIVTEDPHAGMTLIKVSASLATGPAEAVREHLTISAAPVPGQPGEYAFDLSGRMPVDRVRILLPEKNSLIHAGLSSRARETDPWIQKKEGIAYRLDTREGELSSSELTVTPNGDRFWKLKVDTTGGGMGVGDVRIEVAWVPHRIMFMPRGKAPFILAFGSGRADTRSIRGVDLLAQLPDKDVEKASKVQADVGEASTLGGQNALKTRISAVTRKKIVLWGVLLAGVGVLAWMAIRLQRQMGRETEEQSPRDIS